MAEIVEFRPAMAALNSEIFSAVCEMEGDLRAIDEFADALALVSETMDESPHANAINRLAWEIKHRAQRWRHVAMTSYASRIRTRPNLNEGKRRERIMTCWDSQPPIRPWLIQVVFRAPYPVNWGAATGKRDDRCPGSPSS
jgi:hypothetical protein